MRAEGVADTAVNAKKITARRLAFAAETLSFGGAVAIISLLSLAVPGCYLADLDALQN
jgi:hypothetical protein